MLDNFYSADVLDAHYEFVKDSPGQYPYPGNAAGAAETIACVRTFPVNDSPGVFGLHSNANTAVALSDTSTVRCVCLGVCMWLCASILSLVLCVVTQLLNVMLAVDSASQAVAAPVVVVANDDQPRNRRGSMEGEEEALADSNDTSRIDDILSRLPEPFDIDIVREKYPVHYNHSMHTVLLQELLRYNNLLAAVASSLKNLRGAMSGLVLMDPSLEEVSTSLANGWVPKAWAKVGYPSLKPLSSWVPDLLARVAFFQDWVDNGAPSVYWISGFFFTQSFLTGTLQDYARKHQVPIDTIGFDFDVRRGLRGV